jgi:hypothetical protein
MCIFSDGDAEGVQYEIDHLATFTVGSKTGKLLQF